ncbi:MAG: redoxin domain-containing protein [Myxococcota bacterium]|nr:redoxin domain-containing protein [Myxococcota bacterium]
MAIKVGTHAPHVTLFDTERKAVTFPDHGHATVIAFFPAAFTSVCTKELCTFRDAISDYRKLQATVLGISVDSPFALAEFKKQQNLPFALLSDHKHEAIKAYDVVFPNLANLGFTAATRSVFVVDAHGNVSWAWVSTEPKDEPRYEDVKKAVEAAAGHQH